MPRIRSVKPEFWTHFPTARLSRDARLLYIGLWNFADEHARLAGDPRFVKGQVFPYDDDLDATGVDALLDELEAAGKVERYSVDGAPFLLLPGLGQHQRLEPGKVPSRLPGPEQGHRTGRPARRADSSARDPDESPPDPDPHPVDNPKTEHDEASAQVRAQSARRADESARDADSSALLYVAGSMEQGTGSMGAAAAAPRERANDEPPLLPPAVEILRAQLDARKLTVRWDKLDASALAEIEALIDLHGDGPLVRAAVQSYRPDSPPAFAQAWLASWRALPAPGHLLRVADPACTEPGHTGTTRYCVQCAAEQKAAR